MWRSPKRTVLVGLTILLVGTAGAAAGTDRPNVIFILADDLGYGDLGSYGQRVIRTPSLDRMAAEGIRFTHFYAGATVCAPSRSVLMTGQHTGRTHVRGNARGTAQSLREEDVTVAEVLKSAGYATGLFGKWGLGEVGMEGHPLSQGFDAFYGYLNQVHAHNYYPEFLWRGLEKVSLRNTVERTPRPYGGFEGGWATERYEYSHDLIMQEALAWVEEQKDAPFFLYLALTIPHANNEATRAVGDGAEVPEYGVYDAEDWPNPDKGQAAMITRMDRDVGTLLRRLGELGIAEKTLVMFSSDNGPHNESNHDLLRFNPSGNLRGIKRDLYDGGIRVPFLAWWPGTIQPGQVSDHIGYFGDLMATVAELVDVEAPLNIDSISFAPTLRGRAGDQRTHDYLYWEFYEAGSSQAVRLRQWKGVRRPMLTGRLELYDVLRDEGERYDVARNHPEVVEEIAEIMEEAHVPHPNWSPPGR
ncbi:MAG: arylsulfatase [Acidobacteriota bacterium]|nr:arylsulfatase [Acidobacteriota bacterium]MDE3264205.1 arylsulfatase [Acidobacteriota bacterium]